MMSQSMVPARRVAEVATFIVTLPRDTPYLGPLGPGESVNARGYIVRKGNGVIYPTVDRSIVVRVTTDDGAVGWGETYGICAPRATCEIVNELLAPVLVGRDPEDVAVLWDEMYGLMRVRGGTSGFHTDAIAALDMALWDLRARGRRLPLVELLGGARRTGVPCYLSGLPCATLDERVELARDWQQRGIDSFKFAAVVSHEGIAEEFAALRAALGPETELMADLHWKFSADEAQALANDLARHRPLFLEAPVKPEDISGLARVAAGPVPIAAGEEWGSRYDAGLRLAQCRLAYVQPEMAHTGVTQFRHIADLAGQQGALVAPHATIGVGIFLAASLHASASIEGFWKHEWQHSIFDKNLALLDTDMACAGGTYRLPTGPGLGAAPNAAFSSYAERVR